MLSAGVLAVAALLVGRDDRDDPPAPGAVSSHPVAVSSSAQESTDPARCPEPPSCSVSSRFPDAGAAALREEFPDASPGTAATVRLRGGRLWFRQLTARAGSLAVIVRIQQADAVTALEPDRVHAVSYVREDERGFVVQIQVEGPLRDIPPIDRLYRLAADLRLFETS